MRLILVLQLFLTLLCSQDISEKLIVSGHEEIKKTELQFLKLKHIFIENETNRALQKIHQLHIEIETLGDYSMLVIRPIRSLAVKNELLVLLSPVFPEIFSIKDLQEEIKVGNKKKNNVPIYAPTVPSNTNAFNKVEDWVKEIGLQWIALLLLSIIGLVLSISSRSKMANLEKIQSNLSLKQAQMENEIKNLGATGV